MAADAHAAADFYRTARGVVTARLLRERLALLWPDAAGQSVLGVGYAAPYLRLWREQAVRCLSVTPAQMGVARWPLGAANLSCTAEEDVLPFPDLMFDRVLLVHGLEAAENARRMLREIWRVLKDDGRLLIIVPNRTGLWAYLEFDAVRPWPALFVRPGRPVAELLLVSGGAAGCGALCAAQQSPAGAAQQRAAGADRAPAGAGTRGGDDHRGGEGCVCGNAGQSGAAPALGASRSCIEALPPVQLAGRICA